MCDLNESFHDAFAYANLRLVHSQAKRLANCKNSGHSRATAFVIRCQGENKQPRCFSTWAAIELAGIGKLAASLADRSIEIKLKRKAHERAGRTA